MGHSYLQLGERHLHLHDARIEFAACYLARFGEAHADEFPSARFPYLAQWRDLLDLGVNGALDLALDEHFTTPSTVADFARLAQRARAALLAEPDPVPGPRIDELMGAASRALRGTRSRASLLADLDVVVAFITHAPSPG